MREVIHSHFEILEDTVATCYGALSVTISCRITCNAAILMKSPYICGIKDTAHLKQHSY